MKKYLFIALAAAGMLTSCSSDDAVVNESSNNAEELVPIKIGMGSIATITRGTGTVGTTDATTNAWNGELVKIYMFEKGSMALAMNGTTPIFENAEFRTPVGSNGWTGNDDTDLANAEFATPTDGVSKFYPVNGNFDFWGYRTDGAETATDPTVTAEVRDADNNITTDGTAIIPFNIDGSQDIMGAKTVLNADQEALLGTQTDRIYSAFSARKGVNPQLVFNHLLSRLTFEVKAGNNNAAGVVDPALAAVDPTVDYAVQITAIRVYSQTTGELLIATTAQNGVPAITWQDANGDQQIDASDYSALALKEADGADADLDLDPLAQFTLNGVTDYTPIGEALLVSPGDNTYRLEVAMKQIKHTNATTADPNGNEEIVMDPFEATITIPGTPDDPATPDVDESALGYAEAGSSYKVKIIVYGLEEIKVQTVLTPWVDGGEIEIDPDANL